MLGIRSSWAGSGGGVETDCFLNCIPPDSGSVQEDEAAESFGLLEGATRIAEGGRNMRELSGAERELVAIGAALGSNCVPCIEFHIPEARKAGLSDQQINEAVALADEVRQVPARKVLAAAHRLLPQVEARIHAEQSACDQAIPAAEARACCD